MSSNIYITPRTTLVLIKSLAQETNIYMSTYSVPDFQINVRDATGSPSLLTNPINICTINGAKFTNNTTHYSINQPYGFVNLSLRTSTLWQILHTSGQTPSESAANVQQANISTAYLGFVSTSMKEVSTLFIENLETPNSIQLAGPFVIGNLSTTGSILFQSTMNVYGDATFEKNVFVSGSTRFLSTLWVEELAPLSSVFVTYSSFHTDGSVFVKGKTQIVSTLETQSTLQVNSLQVKKSTLGFTTFLSTLFTEGAISSLRDFQTSTMIVGKALTVGQTVSTLDGLFSTVSLTIEGNMLSLNDVSSLQSVLFQSSLLLQSSLISRNSLDAFSTTNVEGFVSTGFFSTSLLSTFASFSTLGQLTVESNIAVRGTLSTNSLSVLGLVSVGGTLVTQGSVSAAQQAILSSLDVEGTVLLRGLSTQSIGIGGNAWLDGNTFIGTFLQVNSNMKVGSDIEVQHQTFLSSVGVGSDITVGGNMIINGLTTINTYDVTSYGVSTLEIVTSSPSVALRASTLLSPFVESLQGKFVFTPTSGSLNTIVNAAIQTSSLYTGVFEGALFSTQTLYTNAVISERSQVPLEDGAQFEILQKAVFQRGLSTSFVNAESIQGTFEGNFIGDARNISNAPVLFSTISASLVLVSSIETQLFSANTFAFGNLQVALNIAANAFQCQGTTGNLSFFSTGLYYSAETLSTIEGLGIAFFPIPVQELSQSTLALNRIVYLDAGTKKMGIGISSPQYNLDISGTLAYTGTLTYDEIAELNLSTTVNPYFFSSIKYSSVYIRDSLVLPTSTEPLQPKGLFLIPPPLFEPRFTFQIAERDYPVSALTTPYPGINANSNYSTIDINYMVFVHNDTHNVGINTITGNVVTQNTFPTSVPPQYDLYANMEVVASDINAENMNILATFEISEFAAPTVGINPTTPSTLNTFSTPNLSTLVLNNFVELFKDTTLNGYMQIKRPNGAPLRNLFAVYNDAFISSVGIGYLAAETISYQFQDL